MDFLKAILVGLLASAPVGPVLAFVLQTTLTKGRKAGSMAGYGAGLIDSTYSAIAICALGAVEAFLVSHTSVIMIVGGSLIMLIGLKMALQRTLPGKTGKQMSAKLPVQTALMALSNPAAIAVMFGLVAAFNINVETHKALSVFGVWCGTTIWWTFVPWAAEKLGSKLNDKFLLRVNAIFGIIIMIFAAVVIVKGIIH